MAEDGVKISELSEKTTLSGTEYLPVQDGEDNKKMKTDLFQKKLVSGTDIKTFNGESLLGSGNISIDATLDKSSNNAIRNSAVATKIEEITTDTDAKITELDAKTILSSNNLILYQGSIELSGNLKDRTPNTETKNRCYAPLFVTQDVVLEVPDGFEIRLIYGDNEYNAVGSIIYGAKEINTDYPYGLLVVAKSGNGDFTPQDVKIVIKNKSLNNDIKSTKEEIQNINGDIDTINTEVASLNNDVETLNRDIDNDSSNIMVVAWEDGALDSTNGGTTTTANRKRTIDYVKLSNVSVIEFTETIQSCFMIMFYNRNKSFISTYLGTYSFASTNADSPLDVNNIAPDDAVYFKIMIKSDIASDSIFVFKGGVGINQSIEKINAELSEIKEKINSIYHSEDVIVVDSKGEGDYTTIEDALKNANDSDDNHVIIYVMPGIYHPAPKKGSSSVPYEESNRNISIIGADKNSCVLKGNVGYYYYQINVDYALLRLNGNVTIENLTLDNRSDLYESTANENGWDLVSPHCRAYCIHCDGTRQENSIIEIRNCNLYNDHFTCIGFGTRPNSTLKIIECEVVSDVSSEKNAQSGFSSYGTLYGHLEAGGSGVNQNLHIVRCVVENTNYGCAINLMDSASEGAEGNVVLIQNACATTDDANAFKKVDKFILNKLSSGNNVSKMNYTA